MTSHVTFKQGVKECIPTLLDVGIGLSFGIVASQHFSIIEILLLCLLVYAGAHNLLYVRLWLLEHRSQKIDTFKILSNQYF